MNFLGRLCKLCSLLGGNYYQEKCTFFGILTFVLLLLWAKSTRHIIHYSILWCYFLAELGRVQNQSEANRRLFVALLDQTIFFVFPHQPAKFFSCCSSVETIQTSTYWMVQLRLKIRWTIDVICHWNFHILSLCHKVLDFLQFKTIELILCLLRLPYYFVIAANASSMLHFSFLLAPLLTEKSVAKIQPLLMQAMDRKMIVLALKMYMLETCETARRI